MLFRSLSVVASLLVSRELAVHARELAPTTAGMARSGCARAGAACGVRCCAPPAARAPPPPPPPPRAAAPPGRCAAWCGALRRWERVALSFVNVATLTVAVAIAICLRVLSIVLWATYVTRALPAALVRQRAAAADDAAANGDDVVDWTPAWTWGAALPLSAAALIAQFVKLAFILAAARRVDHLPHVASCGAHRRLAQQLARTAIKATVVVSPLSVAAPVKAAAAAEAENPQ